MKTYLCGGAVRDTILGKRPHDFDYVVVGSTPEYMESMGYKQVGKDFPVYLHPDTGEEYALARVERKSGLKHTDFETVSTSGLLNPELIKQFVELGFDPAESYPIQDLIQVFRRITQ